MAGLHAELSLPGDNPEPPLFEYLFAFTNFYHQPNSDRSSLITQLLMH
jgi:hypothetical protein